MPVLLLNSLPVLHKLLKKLPLPLPTRYCNPGLSHTSTTFDLSWLPQNKSLVEILELVFEHTNNLTTKRADKEFYQTEGLKELLELLGKNGAQWTAVSIQNAHCIAVYGSQLNAEAAPVYCVQQTSKGLLILREAVFPRQNIKQILTLTHETVALLLHDAVEIWYTSEKFRLVQRITQTNAVQMAVGTHNNLPYLAVIVESKPNTLQHGIIEIYRCKNGSHYEHLQSMDCTDPLQVMFNALHQSHDLLLHVLTATSDQPLIVYQYKGVAGFEKIVGASVLPVATRMQLLELKAAQRHLIALLGRDEITFVEIVLRRF